MQAFDASSIMYAWDNYPEDQFPGLWEWVGERVDAKDFVMLNVAFKEVKNIMPDCADWIMGNSLDRLAETNETLQNALMIAELLGIKNDQYGTGVGENDILIIASAKEHGQELVTNESRQKDLPKDMKRYKIPAVCGLPEVRVPSLSFIEIIKRSGVVFG